MPSNPIHIALDATYSVGDTLSGVGLYSHEIPDGPGRRAPGGALRFLVTGRIVILRARRAALPSNSAAAPVWPNRLGRAGADLFHGLTNACRASRCATPSPPSMTSS